MSEDLLCVDLDCEVLVLELNEDLVLTELRVDSDDVSLEEDVSVLLEDLVLTSETLLADVAEDLEDRECELLSEE